MRKHTTRHGLGSGRRRRRPKPLRSTSLVAFLAALPLAHAQTPPDAGSLLRESERELRPPRSQPARIAPQPSQPLAEDAKATRVTVQRIQITGASLLPESELQALLADRIGQSLTLAELEHAAQRIAQHYRERGWFVRVYLPQQDVTDGTIRIQVLEGRYEGSRLENKGRRANSAWVERVVTGRLVPGEPLAAADLERGLLLANDLPGIRATGLLKAGESQGTTRLSLQVEDTPLLTGDISLNNHGVKSTGRTQAVGGIALNNLSGIGDQLSLRALAAEDIANVQLGYSLPIHPDGWRLATRFSSLRYALGDRYRALDAQGKAHTAGINLIWDGIRQQDRNLKFTAGFEHRRYDDDALDAPLRRHRVDAYTLGITGDRRDSLLGGGISWGSLQWTNGKLDIRDVAGDKAADAAGPRSQGNYNKLAFTAHRLQALGASGWQLQAQLAGQWADGNLGSSEQFSLGGPNRVRAYPVNEGSGDEGLLFKLELQKNLGKGWQAIAFYDTGRIRQHKHTWTGWQGGGNQPNSYSLSGAGLGINWNQDGWQLNAHLASPIDGNPGKGADGRNNDGSKVSALRGWISLGRVF